MLERVCVVALALVVSACAKAPQIRKPSGPESRVQRYRPSWTVNLPVNLPGIRACLEGREAPRFVAHVEPLASGAVGVTTIDAYGVVQHCASSKGKVVRREDAQLKPQDLAGLPLFFDGPARPVVETGILEQVLDQDTVLGWLCWLSPPQSAATE